MKIVFVGDVHAQPHHLDECVSLFGLLRQVRSEHPESLFVFLGDQTHTHDVQSVRVLDFWRTVFSELDSLVIVGNHDQSVPGSAPHAMDSFQDVARVVWPTIRIGPAFFASYCKERSQFAKNVAGEDGLLVCHQEVGGFAYETGRVIEEGVDLPPRFAQVVSGHLHTPQESGRVWFPGSPRWLTLADANVQERAVWVAEIAESGVISKRVPYQTAGVCRRVVSLTDTEDSPAELVVGADCRVLVRGTPDFVSRRRRELQALGARVRGIIEGAAVPAVRESEGVEASLRTFASGFQAPNGTQPARLLELLRQHTGLNL